MSDKPLILFVGIDYAINNYFASHKNSLPKSFDVEFISLDLLCPSFTRRSLLDLPAVFSWLFYLLRRKKPSYVISAGPKIGLLVSSLSLLNSFSHIHWFTGQPWATCRFKFLHPSYWVDLFICLFTSCLLSDSPSQAQFLSLSFGPLFHYRRIKTTKHGSISPVDTRLFELGNNRLDAPVLLHPKIKVGFLGRLAPDKGLDIILRLSKDELLKNKFLFLIAGPLDSNTASNNKVSLDPFESRLLSACDSTPSIELNVGYMDKLDFFSSVDILLIPSKREGFGTICIEAAAAGLPVIKSNIYGLVDSSPSFVSSLPCNSYRDYVHALLLLSSPDLYSILSRQGYSNSLNYHPDVFCSDLAQLYQSCLL